MGKLVLIDGDMITHRVGYACEPTKTRPERANLNEAIFRADEFLRRIVDTCSATEYRVFLSGRGNYRKVIFPEYKAHRAGQPRPFYLDTLRELLVREWQAELCSGYEADDGIGMALTEHPDAIVASNDKDFRQLEGEIYNPVRDEFEVVGSQEAAFNFYCQMLEGDSADNIRGIDGIGPVKARRALSGLDPAEMHLKVRGFYEDEHRFLQNFRLLRILRSPEEYRELLGEYGIDEATIGEGEGEETPAEST